MLHSRKRLCALLLSGVMLLSQLPITALAEEYQPVDGQIASFEALPAEVAEQSVPLGTGLDGLDLPETVTATVYHVREDVVIPVTPDETEEPPAQSEPTTEGTEPGASTPEEPVTEVSAPEEPVQDSGETVVTVATATEDLTVASWDSAPAYDGDTAGRYVFTPQFQVYTLAPGVQPPKITVTVEEPKPSAITVTNWTFADDTYLNNGVLPLNNVSMEHQADFDTVVSMLPARISAQIEGEAAPVALDLTWSCPNFRQDEHGHWPLSGTYAFTAALPQGYACDPLPTVPVLLPPSGEGAVLLAGDVCTCTTPCLKDAVNAECPVCSASSAVWNDCGGYLDAYSDTLLRLLHQENGLLEKYVDAKYLLYLGVVEYQSGTDHPSITKLDISKTKLASVLPDQGPLTGKLYFPSNTTAGAELKTLNCTGQSFTEIDLSRCGKLVSGGFSCVGNPIRHLVLNKNGASITVKPYSGGRVTVAQETFLAGSLYTCTFSAEPDDGYKLVGIEGYNYSNASMVFLDLYVFPGDNVTIKPTFARTTPEEGYSSTDGAVIQRLLTDNGLSQYVSNDYSGWEKAGLVKWNNETPKRVTELNVNGLGLTALDVSALTALTALDCGDNPIGSLKLSDALSLTIQTTGGRGKVTLDRFDWSTKQATLTASATHWGDSFYQWQNASTDKTPTTTVTINGNVTAVAEFQTDASPLYHPGDVEILRTLIRNHGMEGSYGLDPASWGSGFVAWTDVANNKRIKELKLYGWEGTVDVSGLTELEWLDCNDCSLSGLVAKNLSKLGYLSYNRTPLISLDLAGCSKLWGVSAFNVETLTSYTAPNGHTATVTIDGEHGDCVAYLTPHASGGNNPVNVSSKAAAGWYLVSVDKSTLDISSGDATATVTFAQVQKPGAPKGLTTTGGEEQATLTWEAPDNIGGELTGYQVTSDNWATTIPLGSNVSSYTFTSLPAGHYTLKVRAVNTAGNGLEASEACTVSAITVPGAPLDLSATVKGGQITLTWKAPDSGSAPTGYQVTMDDWTHTIPLDKHATTYSFDGLANGEYTLKVRAVNKAGEGAEATANCEVKDDSPPVLSGGSATRISDTEATVTFTIDEVGVFYYLVSDSEENNPSIPTDEAGTPCVEGSNTFPVTGLSAGENFVYIKAKDANGNVSVSPLEVTVPASSQLELSIQNTGDGDPVLGTDYLYGGGVLTILSDTPMTIANVDPGTPTKHRVVVKSSAGATLTLNGVNIDIDDKDGSIYGPPAFELAEGTGAVKLLLANENTLIGDAGGGLQTQYGAKLTIDSAAGSGSLDGTLTAVCNARLGAGIGSGRIQNSTAVIDITIAGGTINAKGYAGAGIGGGRLTNSTSDIDITITGGMIKAEGGDGAGIGGGSSAGGSTAIDITITGGIVNATSIYGAGIGGGHLGNSTSDIDITITGGTIKATSTEGGAGIGKGTNNSVFSANSHIEIRGGMVTASAHSRNIDYSPGAGIGGAGNYVGQGDNGNDNNSGGTILITGDAHVIASATDAAAIGGGSARARSNYCNGGGGGSITISGNAQVQATTTEFGAGIGGGGGGSRGDGGDSGTIIIKDNAVVFAAAGADGLAIGGGGAPEGNYGDSSGVNIQGGVVFEQKAGQVHGNVTLPADLKIPQDHTLTVPQGRILSNDHTLTNQGVIDGMGVLTGDGTFGGDGEYILKVFRTIKAPTAASVAVNSVTLNEAVVSKGDGKVQYAVNRTPTAPGQWQDGTEFTGLNPSTTYYFFARVTGSKTYQDVVSGAFAQATTEKETYSLSVDKRDLDFGSAETGYSAPAAQTVTVTNTGNQTVTLSKPTSTHFLVGELSPSGTLTAGGKASFTVQPKPGFGAGEYSETLTIGGSGNASATVKVNFKVTTAPSYLLSATPDTLNFGSVEAGYSAPAAQTVTVTNTGNQSITLTKPTSANYTVGDFSPSGIIAAGGQATFTVQPQTGLGAGSYSESLALTGSGNASASVSLRFTVTQQSTSGGGGGGGGGSSNSNSGGNISVEPSKPTEQDPNPPTVGVITPPATVDKDGNVKVDVSDKDIQNAIDKAIQQAKKDGTEANGIAVCINLSGLQTTFYHLPLTLSQNAYGLLVNAGVQYISILTPQISLKLDLETLKTIHANADGKVTIDATQIDRSKLADTARTALGSRPAYDLTITSGGKTISQFGGYVALTLPYTLHDREQGGELQMVWLDSAGQVRYMTGSSYNDNQKAMLGRTNHFTVFGIAEKPAPVFTDIAGHWAKDDILFVASRELLNGTAPQVFTPNGDMTRGMFVTALGRLAEIDPASYKTGRFTDVAADTYYAPFVNWAASKGVVSGTGADTFAPNQPVTRQQMATIMQNYAKAMGYELPVTREAVTFTDDGSIASWAKDAVRAMQQAGVLMGKDGNRFDPTGTATRAEVSAVLHRYAELIIDPQTAQGWDRNDSGKWVYFVDGKAVTGERVIDGTTYHFDEKGQLTKIDAIAPEGKKYVTYKVQKDDTLWSIAEQHNCTVAEIVALNKALIADPNQILVGWELKIPQT